MNVDSPAASVPAIVTVGVDGSAESRTALRWAAELAARLHASVDAVAVWQVPPAADWSLAAADWDPERDAASWLNESVDDAFGTERPENLRLLVRQGYPARVLLELSKNALMLVVGSRGRGGFTGLLLGSVSAKCAEHAQCPVLVVHGDRTPDGRAYVAGPSVAQGSSS